MSQKVLAAHKLKVDLHKLTHRTRQLAHSAVGPLASWGPGVG